jgi:hypothetical protein
MVPGAYAIPARRERRDSLAVTGGSIDRSDIEHRHERHEQAVAMGDELV